MSGLPMISTKYNCYGSPLVDEVRSLILSEGLQEDKYFP